jgi:fumarate reductase flavoprotein subunit
MDSSGKTAKAEELNCEIAIVGGGGSGLAAAVAAAEKGVKVIVLEKRKVVGGNSALATGLFGTATRLQERMRLFLTADEVFKSYMEYSRLEVDPRIFRAFLNKSGDTIHWLEEKGVEFDGAGLFFNRNHKHILPVYHAVKADKGAGGAAIVKTLVKSCKDLGVQLFTQTATTKILKDPKGKVTGVAAGTEGKEFVVAAKSVIIATGGHGSNKELLKKYQPCYTEDLDYIGIPLMGDGVIMTAEAGGRTGSQGTLLTHGPWFTGVVSIRALIREPYAVWVNKNGERYVDEGCPYIPVETANALQRQPDKVSYCLLDEKMKRRVMEKGVKMGAGYKVTSGTRLTDLDGVLRLEADKGTVKIADSWDEIARWIGAPPKALKATMKEYNHSCDQGYDKDFLKERDDLVPLRTPPYYGIKCTLVYLDTFGGITVNHRMEVLGQQNSPIPGLYAVGVTTDGWVPKTYCIKLAGNAFGFAVNSGRIAGENAARYIKRAKAK